MNNTEVLAKKWLIKQGYKENEIVFNKNISPDFICNDGKRYEVKFLYGNRLLFSKVQIPKLKPEDEILVFNKEGLFNKFKWKNKDKVMFNIHITDYNKYGITMRMSKETKIKFRQLEVHQRETDEQLLLRLINDKLNNMKKEVRNRNEI